MSCSARCCHWHSMNRAVFQRDRAIRETNGCWKTSSGRGLIPATESVPLQWVSIGGLSRGEVPRAATHRMEQFPDGHRAPRLEGEVGNGGLIGRRACVRHFSGRPMGAGDLEA